MLTKLNWDSNFFGKSIYKTYIDKASQINCIEEYFLNNNIDLCYVYSKVPIANNFKYLMISYSSMQYSFVKKNDFLFDAQKNEYNEAIIFNEKFHSRNHLYKLAYISGHRSRFQLDTSFTRQEFENLYKQWIDNTIDGKFGDVIILETVKSKIVGMVTVTSYDCNAKIGLISVDPNHRGHGVGKKLVNHFENYYRNNDYIKYYIIDTQSDNIGAIKLYKKCGYEVKYNTYVYHVKRK